MLASSVGFGLQTNGFGFTISWATNASVVVEACTNLFNPVWVPVQTLTLNEDSCYFRFYRLAVP